jgi:arsenite methyltransferase
MTDAMAERARAAARALGLTHVEVRLGDALDLPVDSTSVNAVISNGVLNLTPDKERAFGEVVRVLAPGGEFLYADIIVANELSESIRPNIDLWTARIAGALPEAELIDVLQRVGFTDVRLVERFEAFEGTSKERTARKYGVIGVNVYARKP